MKKIITLIALLLLSSCSIDMIELKNKKQSIREKKIEKLQFKLKNQRIDLEKVNIELSLTKKDLIILNKEIELNQRNIDINKNYKKMLQLDIDKSKSKIYAKTNPIATEDREEVPHYSNKKYNKTNSKTNNFIYVKSHNKNIPAGSIYIQIGAFSTKAFAEAYKKKSIENGFNNIKIEENLYYLVLVGNYKNLNSAIKSRQKLRKIGFIDAYIKKYY